MGEGWINPLLVSFVSTSVAELGDKTQLAALALAARYKAAVPVFTGCFLGFLILTVAGATLGERLSRKIPGKILGVASGVVFVAVGVVLLLTA